MDEANREQSLNVAAIMIPKVETAVLHSGDTVRQGYEKMRHNGYTAVPVLSEKEEYLGSITEGDLLRFVFQIGSLDVKDLEQEHIGHIFRKDFAPPLTMDATAEELWNATMRQNFVPIVDARGYLSGIVTRRRFLQYLKEHARVK
ncbi:MAG: CBS domain-containing protein [Peptoniphilaceae bacterium]|nr:CBS domain-containing protein [Peptoniphilaceae bacterium]MDD7543084.1 CBS domain-containing protein [Peptoniphilaceae bacterium]MDY3076502.1 CBS domain-containing protein [Peptoniphilaceae bacterium]MDY5765464.1 CBS domain-containing protein [Peptoniphilaceae bacterium]